MLSFKQWLFDQIEIKKSAHYNKLLPVSIGARNVNIARKELNTKLKDSLANNGEMENKYRGVYDMKTRQFYLWWALDTLHNDMLAMYKITRSVKLTYNSDTKKLLVINYEFKFNLDDVNHEKAWKTYFGKRAKVGYFGETPELKWWA